MSSPIKKSEKTSPIESAKLIEEMQTLIKEKGLKVKLEVKEDLKEGGIHVTGCATCTICPCMICW